MSIQFIYQDDDYGAIKNELPLKVKQKDVWRLIMVTQ